MDRSKVLAYEIIEERDLPEIQAKAYTLVHKKSKAKIICLECDDNNKVFNIGFRTPPADDTGVAHIIEHTVLCGSKKYPVKDPFIELVKGSLNTFLNAMTYPEKTLYPVASTNDADFQNLLDVYMDAVFHPNIYNTDLIFKQEGWHYEMEDVFDDLKINGVVYNEMKGAFSSEEDVLERAIMHSLYPDTSYSNESGGDPDYIPELTYEDYINFHKKYYHPANSFIYLYGDMDMNEKLEYIDREYLSEYDYLEVDSNIEKQKPFAEMIFERKEYPIMDNQSTEDKTTLSYNMVVGDIFDNKLSIAMQMIDYALIGMSGAPLKQALLDKGIGKDVSAVYEGAILQPYYSITAEMANESDKDEFVKTIRETLLKITEEGLDKMSLMAAINNLEFNYREMDFGRYPKGLMLGLRIYDSWVFDATDVYQVLDCGALFDELRELINTNYYDEIVRKYLLDNTHGSVIINVPVKGLAVKKDNELKEELREYKDSLSEEEILAIVNNTKELKDYQSEPSAKEEIEKIPVLSIEDISKEPEKYDVIKEKVLDVDLYNVNLFTNKISYIDFAFDISNIPYDYLPYITILKYVLSNISTKNYSYDALCNEIMLNLGELSFPTSTMFTKSDFSEYIDTLEVYIKCFDGKIGKAVELANEIIQNTIFDDYNRIYEILGELMSKSKNKILDRGNSVALHRAQSYYEEKAYKYDMRNGIGYFKFLEKIFNNYDECKEELVERLKTLMKWIFRKDNLFVAFTHEYDTSLIKPAIEEFKKALSDEKITFEKQEFKPNKANEAFITPGQVQYVCRAGKYAEESTPSFIVLSTILSYDYLWNNVRVKGGAYGCSASFTKTRNVLLSSYRDPNLRETNDVYENLADYVENFDCDDRDMTKYIIGTFSGIDTPNSTANKGTQAFNIAVSKRTYEERKADRIKILSTTQEDIRNLAGKIKEALGNKNICCIGSEAKIIENKELFDEIINLFE